MMEFVNGKDDIQYMKWKIKLMFETTNQIVISKSQTHLPLQFFPQPNLLTIQQKTMETISQMNLVCLATGVTIVYLKQGVSKFPTNMVIETQKYGDVSNFVSTKVT